MDNRGGCCIARYGGGGVYDMSQVHRIMLRFRPIAPKPAAGSGSLSPPAESKDNMHAKPTRGKRRYVKDNNSSNSNKCSYRKRKASSSCEEKPAPAVTTLPLLPLSPETKELAVEQRDLRQKRQNGTVWLNFSNNCQAVPDMMMTMMSSSQRILRSWVIVECVTDTWVDSHALGCTDNQRRMNLEKDTCPGFISNGLNNVTWTNPAFRKMVGQQHGRACEENVFVSLVMKERVTLTCPAFTCRVRMQYTCGKEKGSSMNSMTLPCDVWRMDGGNFAWRLDVDAALSLGR